MRNKGKVLVFVLSGIQGVKRVDTHGNTMSVYAYKKYVCMKHTTISPPITQQYPPTTPQGYAVRCGMAAARGEYILFSDADGATPVAEVEKLEGEMKRLLTGDVVEAPVYARGAVHASAFNTMRQQRAAFVLGSRAHLEQQVVVWVVLVVWVLRVVWVLCVCVWCGCVGVSSAVWFALL